MDNEKHERRRFQKLQNLERARRERIDNFVLAAMQTPSGRDYFYWLLELCSIGRNPFTANALSTSFNCGELNVGQQIQAHIIEVTPADYLRMLQERQEEQDGRRTDTDDAEPAE